MNASWMKSWVSRSNFWRNINFFVFEPELRFPGKVVPPYFVVAKRPSKIYNIFVVQAISGPESREAEREVVVVAEKEWY